MIIGGHTLPCYFADCFCTPTTKTPRTLVWLSYDFCLIFTLQNVVGRKTKIEGRYWIENLINPTLHMVLKELVFHLYMLHIHNPHYPSLSRFELLPRSQKFCSKPEPPNASKYSDVFVPYTNGFNMHTGQPHPYSK